MTAGFPDGPAGETEAAGRRPVTRGWLIGGLAALVLVAGLGGGLAALLSSGSGSGHVTGANGAGANGAGANGALANGAAGNAATRSSAATPAPASASSSGSAKPAAAGGKPAASARPRASPSPGACLVGTWRAVNQQFTNSINDQAILFTGPGGQATVKADGTSTTVYNGTVFSADVDGVEWTQTFTGSTSAHWSVANGNILFNEVSGTGTVVLRDDGVYNNSGPIESQPGAVPYECSAKTLRETFPNGGSDVLTRVSRS